MKVHRSGVTALYIGGARVRFMCPSGHETVRDYSQGPAERRLTDAGAHRLAVMWDDQIVARFVCRKCPTEPRRRKRLGARLGQVSG
jgi:hypothetical protein